MKKWLGLSLIAIVAVSYSCKKIIEEKQRDIVIQAITTGHWYVEQYKQDSIDVTGDFFGYEFQFYENGNVDGIISSTTKKGTWSSDVNNHTITAIFPQSAGDTLTRLNYTWIITDSYLDYVEAKTATSTGDNILHLRKK